MEGANRRLRDAQAFHRGRETTGIDDSEAPAPVAPDPASVRLESTRYPADESATNAIRVIVTTAVTLVSPEN